LPYIIDGHNLIGAMKQIRLDDPDDEMLLVGELRRYCARTRRQVTVYFDRGAPAMQAPKDAGRLSVRFIRPPRSADQAIVQHLARLKGSARNWTVVSSDQEVQAVARRTGARVLSSHEFARSMSESDARSDQREKPGDDLTEDDVKHWQELFRKSRQQK
jgi:predicted RNA-binding protein with PIN domain